MNLLPSCITTLHLDSNIDEPFAIDVQFIPSYEYANLASLASPPTTHVDAPLCAAEYAATSKIFGSGVSYQFSPNKLKLYNNLSSTPISITTQGWPLGLGVIVGVGVTLVLDGVGVTLEGVILFVGVGVTLEGVILFVGVGDIGEGHLISQKIMTI